MTKGRAWRALVLVLSIACGLAGLVSLGLRRGFDRWILGPPDYHWPVVEHMELDLDLDRAPRMHARAELELSGLRDGRFHLLLNRDLEIESARTADGSDVRWSRGPRILSRYHSEGRVIEFELARESALDHASIILEYAGVGADETSKKDWMGILLLARDQFRMSPQSVFYPEVPSEIDGPGVEPSRANVRVRAPSDLEVFVTGRAAAPRDAGANVRAWSFEVSSPSTLSLVAGRYHRTESEEGGARIVSLLRPEHAGLDAAFHREARAVIAFYGSHFGPAATSVLALAEIDCLADTSYNWSSSGLMVFDRSALGDDVPIDKLAHEAAHLWWGQTVAAHGKGERFLTESLAEYSSWRALAARDGETAAVHRARDARERCLRTAHEEGSDPAIADVTFATPGYDAFAYAKGALVLWSLDHALGRDVLDRVLASYASRFRGGAPSLDDFLRCFDTLTPEVLAVAPWLMHAGHAHLALAGVTNESGIVRGVIESAPCSKGIESVAQRDVTLELRSLHGVRSERLALTGARTTFSFPIEHEVEIVSLDPLCTIPMAEVAPAILGGARVVRSAPAHGARDVAFGPTRIEIEFDRALVLPSKAEQRQLSDTWWSGAQKLGLAAPWLPSFALENEDRTLVLHTGPLAPGKEHLLTLERVLVDTHGIPVQRAELRFHTRASDDREAPRIEWTSPAMDARDVDARTSEIRIRFSEPMGRSSGFKIARVQNPPSKECQFPKLGDARWEEDGRLLIWKLPAGLEPATTYFLPFGERYLDWSGNRLADFDLIFTTR